MNATSLITGGFHSGKNTTRRSSVSALSLTTDGVDYRYSKDIADFAENVVLVTGEATGILTLTQKPDGTGIDVEIEASFPEEYIGAYYVLRGKYDYITDQEDTPYKLVYSNNSLNPQNQTITDSSLDPNHNYYYTVIALCGGSDGRHLQLNLLESSGTSYRYNVGDATDFLANRLPQEWDVSDGTFAKRYISIFGDLFDTIKSDVETYILKANNIQDSLEDHLEYLGSIIDWPAGENTSAAVARKELKNATSIYQKKGRDEAIKFLIQLSIGWEVSFERGYKRLARAGLSNSVFNPNDLYALSRKGVPETYAERENLGAHGGTAGETFTIPNVGADNIVVELYDGSEYTTWLEVDDFSSSSSTDEHYVISETSRYSYEVEFGDGINGAMPTGETVYASYYYGGDVQRYIPSNTDSWYNSVGTNVRLTETVSSEPLTASVLSKLRSILNLLTASHAIYKLALLYSEFETPSLAEGSYSDSLKTAEILVADLVGHTADSPDYYAY